MMLSNLASAIQVTSGGDIDGGNVQAPELRALLETFVSSSGDIAYATVLNAQGKGVSAGRIDPSEAASRRTPSCWSARPSCTEDDSSA
jgi:hypothetical protein